MRKNLQTIDLQEVRNYAYDADGQLLGEELTTDVANSVRYSYDDNGNLAAAETKRGKSVARHEFKYSDADQAVDYKRHVPCSVKLIKTKS